MNYLLSLIILFLSVDILALEKSDSKNSFTLSDIESYLPGKNISDELKTQIKAQLIQNKNDTKLWRFFIKENTYVIALFFQEKNNLILDLYLALPSYFLHDSFHQTLINKFGKQDRFLHHNGTSVYSWINKSDIEILYSATCTITCFPIFLNIYQKNNDSGFIPFSKGLNR